MAHVRRRHAYQSPSWLGLLIWTAVFTAIFWLAASAPAYPSIDRVDATQRPTCTEGKPLTLWLLNETDSRDCDATAGGTVPAMCCCDGDSTPEWAPCSGRAWAGAYYFDDTASDIGGYNQLLTTPDTATSEDDDSVSVTSGGGEQLIDTYATNAGDPGVTLLPGGVWEFSTFTYVSSTAGTTVIRYKVYKRASGGAETLLFTADSPSIENTTVREIDHLTAQSDFVLAATDRIVIKVYGATTNAGAITVHFTHNGTTHYSHLHTPFSVGAAGAGSGTVTSVSLTMPAEFSVSGSPVTTSGTLAVTEATQTANTVYAGPTSGGAAAPGFRALVDADVPDTITISNTVNNRRPSVDNPPASAGAYDCEFSGNLCSGVGWTVPGAVGWTTGTVNRIGTSAAWMYDLTTWPGWVLEQGDTSSATVNTLIYLDYTPATNEQWLFKPMSTGAVNATNEARVGICLLNTGDSNESVCAGFHNSSGAERWELYCQNNGTTTVSNLFNTGAGSIADALLLMKSSDTYYLTSIMSATGNPTGGLTSCAKTGVTTFDRIVIVFGSANESPTPIMGMDFIRYYNSVTFAVVNP